MTNGTLFRPEAMQRLDEPDLGSVLRVSAWWLPASFWLLVAAGVAAVAVAARGSFPVYETGVGVLLSRAVNLPGLTAGCSMETLGPLGARAQSSDARSNAGMMYIAVLAGNSRAKLAPGMRVLLRLSGYPDVVVEARLDALGDQLLAADDVRSTLRSLGAEGSGIVGPGVSICGALDTDRFTSGGVEYRIQDGMLASARVLTRREPVLSRLLPRFR